MIQSYEKEAQCPGDMSAEAQAHAGNSTPKHAYARGRHATTATCCAGARSSTAHLEVVWQLAAASIAGVHGDEYAAGGYEADVLAQEVEHLALLLDGLEGRSGLRWHQR
jgi:hypothetical protein